MLNLTHAVRWTAAASMLLALSGCGKENESAPYTESTPDATPAGSESTVVNTGTEPDGLIEAFNGQMCSVLSTSTLDSGIVIDELVIGTGEECPEGATVTMQYHGTLADGTVFDTTRDDEPRGPWPLGNLIKGWQQGVPGMKVGGIRRLTIPYQLAYGEAGSSSIPPKADLTFIIELVTIEP